MKLILFYALFLATLPSISHAGHGTIRETDTQFIVEYSGDDNEVKTGIIAKEKEERTKEAEAEKIRQLEEKHAAQRAKSEARKAKEEMEER